MEALSIFAVTLTMLLLGFVVIMLAIAGFCSIVKKIERTREINPRLAKWVYILDWIGDDKDD